MTAKLELEFTENVGIATYRNGGNLIVSALLRNEDDWLEDVTLTLTPDMPFFPEVTVRFDSIAPGQCLDLVPVLKVVPDLDYIASLEVRTPTIVRLALTDREGFVLGMTSCTTDVLPYNFWSGMYMPESIASFVTPNADQLAVVRDSASRTLEAWGVSGSLEGYQGDSNRVVYMGAAVYSALKKLGIRYVNPPADFENDGQRVRLSSEIIEKREGTCIDLSVLFCSVLESIGLNTVIFVVKGHAFAGFWLVDDHCEDIISPDPSRFTRAVRNDQFRAVECTMFVSGSNVSFDDAADAALRRLEAMSEFSYAVDIAAARSSILPLPTRTLVDGRWVVEREEVDVTSFAPSKVESFEVATEDKSTTTRVDRWKRELLDTSTRNSLISMKPGTKIIPLLVSDASGFEDALADGKEFSLHSRPQDWDGSGVYGARPFESELYMGAYASAAPGELSRGWLRTPFTDRETEASCRSVFRAASKELEESGCNALFLAVGVLRWFDDRTPRYAPLILVPVEMHKRNSGYTIRCLEEETVFNVTLAELLRQEFEINIPGIDPLPVDDSGVNVDLIMKTVRLAIGGREGWEVLSGAALGVFTFSQYAMWKDLDGNLERLKENEVVRCLVDGTVIPGVRDIDVSGDPYDLCLTVPADGSQIKAVRAAGEGRSFVMHGPPGTGKSQTITNIITDSLYRGKTVLFVAEKKAALDVVESRLDKIGIGNHCLELHSNKTEKSKVLEQLRASLEACKAVDESKLPELIADIEREKSTLDAYVSELHQPRPWGITAYEAVSRYESHAKEDLPDVKVSERYVSGLSPEKIGELDEKVSLAVRQYAMVSDMDGPVMRRVGITSTMLGVDDDVSAALDRAKRASDGLATCVSDLAALNLPIDFNDTVNAFGVVDTVLSVPSEYALDADLNGTVNLLKTLDSLCGRVSNLAGPAGDVSISAQSFELISLADQIDPVIRDLDAKGFKPSALVSLTADIRKLANVRQRLDPDVVQILRVWKDAVFSEDARIGISASYATAKSAGFFSKKKARAAFLQSVAPLLRNPSAEFESLEPTAVILSNVSSDAVDVRNISLRVLAACKEVSALAAPLSSSLDKVVRTLVGAGIALPQFPTIRSRLEGATAKVDTLRGAVETFRTSADALKTTLVYDGVIDGPAAFENVFGTVNRFRGRFFDWASWNVACRWFTDADMSPVVDLIRSGVSEGVARHAVDKGMYRTMFTMCRQRSESLRLFSSQSFESAIDEFRKLDARYTAYNRNLLKYRLYQNTPRDIGKTVEGTEAAVLFKAINSSRMKMSIRQLISRIPNLLPKVCPCLLMSPQSVAQYITHDFPKFDIVVFDESSQIVTAKALGALGRSVCAVVAGDNKQLPPTSFFQKRVEDDDEDAIDVDSFLDDCLGVRMPETYLEWHYRSRHESLIGFSNRMFYGNRMLTFPSPNDTETKVSLVKVKGTYERGKRCNTVEARAVADEIRRRVTDPEMSGMSLGVIAFSISQQTAIEDMVDDMEKSDRAFSKALGALPEPLFIKNLETVQGDERDVILFSIGYGPGKDGNVFQNFGPINRSGGGRRLNVAVSRARHEMVVFSSMTFGDVKVTPLSSPGVRSMREFLRYAANGGRFDGTDASEPRATDSAVLVELASELSDRGYECAFGVGSSEFRVDLAVVDPSDPERYLLGILSDGESYKASVNTRDREYARADVLVNLGWQVMHVWSVEWFFRRESVVNAVISRIQSILEGRGPVESGEVSDESDFGTFDLEDAPPSQIRARRSRRSEYHPYNVVCSSPSAAPYDERTVYTIAKDVIVHESPIAENQLVRTYCKAVGVRRLSAENRTRIINILRHRFSPDVRDPFYTYWAPGTTEFNSYRVPENPDDARDIDCIPLPELLVAVGEAMEQYGSFDEDSAPKVIATMFGFSRVGDRIRDTVFSVMDIAVDMGIVILENGKYSSP